MVLPNDWSFFNFPFIRPLQPWAQSQDSCSGSYLSCNLNRSFRKEKACRIRQQMDQVPHFGRTFLNLKKKELLWMLPSKLHYYTTICFIFPVRSLCWKLEWPGIVAVNLRCSILLDVIFFFSSLRRRLNPRWCLFMCLMASLMVILIKCVSRNDIKKSDETLRLSSIWKNYDHIYWAKFTD